MKRGLLFLCIAAAFVFGWIHYNEIPLAVIGQPSSTGLLQLEKEQPFFAALREKTGIPFRVSYKPLEAVGFKDTHQLQMLKDGTFDLVSLRFTQNGDAEPSLQGIDLVGLNADYEGAQKVIRAYSGTVDRYLQTRFNAKLLGIWSFGPQEFFCRKPIRRLEDIRGMKVRVASAALSSFISDLGGTPAIIPFDDTRNALAIGLVDCAVTSAASGNFAGWPAHARYYFPLAVHFGLNGYAISLGKWQALSPGQRAALQQAFDAYLADLWTYIKTIHLDASSCNTGGECRFGQPYRMVRVSPTQHDIELLRQITRNKLLAEWGARCDRIHPDCTATWQEKLPPEISGMSLRSDAALTDGATRHPKP